MEAKTDCLNRDWEKHNQLQFADVIKILTQSNTHTRKSTGNEMSKFK
jgi:hypothetical protein